jgi:hydroxymethylpyrimidine pyrophosphatase-like HAD family hydrolase
LAQGEFSAKVVSFDFDDTLSTTKGQEKAKQLLAENYRVLIITARQSTDSKSVFEVADKLGIRRSDIFFTNGGNKWHIIKRLGVAIHYDNNQEQIDLINKMTKTEGKLFK